MQDLKANLTEASCSYQILLQQTHNLALEQNDVQTKWWESYQKEHQELCDRLLSFRDKLSHQIMVPVGKKALMRGRLVHTNEIMVCLGDGWFAKRTTAQAVDICQRRMQNCKEMLKKLEKEKELLMSRKSFSFENEAFDNSDTKEVIEPYEEEEEEKWRERHRQKEKEYRQKLAELRKSENSKIKTEEDLWKRLDALDLQEELEDELNRMDEYENGEAEGEESTEEEESEDNDLESINSKACVNDSRQSDQSEEVRKTGLKRKVSFKKDVLTCESDQSNENVRKETDDEELIRILFKHSDSPSLVQIEGVNEIVSPADILTHYMRQKVPKSILKPSPSVQTFLPEAFEPVTNVQGGPSGGSNHDRILVQPVEFPVKAIGEEVVERSTIASLSSSEERPVSRFKAARLAKKK